MRFLRVAVLSMLLGLCAAEAKAQYTFTYTWPAPSGFFSPRQSAFFALQCWVQAYANQIGSSASCSSSANSALCAYGAGWFGTQYITTTVNLANSFWSGYIDNTLLGRMGYLYWDSTQQQRWNGYSWTLYSVHYVTSNGQGQGVCTMYERQVSPGNNIFYSTYVGSSF